MLLAWAACGVLAGSVVAEEIVSVDRTLNSSRDYTVQLPTSGISYYSAVTGKVWGWAGAACGHDAKYQNSEASGKYLEVSGWPVSATAYNLNALATATVPHAYAYAAASITPSCTIVGNSLKVTVAESSRARAQYWDCDLEFSYAYAGASSNTDPIVFGSAQYSSYDGTTLDPFPPDSDGINRYVSQLLSVFGGTRATPGLPGPSIQMPPVPGGRQSINTLTLAQYVRAGSDDDPSNASGTLVYQLDITNTGIGGTIVVWTPGADTAEFAFQFDRTPQDIEQRVLAVLTGTGSPTDIVTVRVAMLQDESVMPNMTLVGTTRTETWVYGSSNPYAVRWPIKSWQAPDLNQGARPSNTPTMQFRADDFVCNSPRPIAAVRWWGTYAGEPGTHRPDMAAGLPFAIDFLPSSGPPHPFSMPIGMPLLSQSVPASRYFVGWSVTGDAVYEYNVRLHTPFPQQPGQEYFVMIADGNDPNWMWQLAATANLDQPAFSPGPGGWLPEPFPDLAFALMTRGNSDFDMDGDVDLADFSHFQGCFNGPNRPPALWPGCSDANLDGDGAGDVDLTDFAVFQNCFNGPNRPSPCP